MCVDWLTLLSSSCDEKEAENAVCRFVVLGVLGRYPSGQRGQTVNLLPSASKVRILACPPSSGLWAVGVWGLIETVVKCAAGFEIVGRRRAGVAQW